MPSEFDDLVGNFVAPVMGEYFGERGSGGNLVPFFFDLNGERHEFEGILFNRRIEEEEAGDGEFYHSVKNERIDAELLLCDEVTRSVITVLAGEWTIESTGETRWKIERVLNYQHHMARVTFVRPWRRSLQARGVEN
jgi:hypothetical protein